MVGSGALAWLLIVEVYDLIGGSFRGFAESDVLQPDELADGLFFVIQQLQEAFFRVEGMVLAVDIEEVVVVAGDETMEAVVIYLLFDLFGAAGDEGDAAGVKEFVEVGGTFDIELEEMVATDRELLYFVAIQAEQLAFWVGDNELVADQIEEQRDAGIVQSIEGEGADDGDGGVEVGVTALEVTVVGLVGAAVIDSGFVADMIVIEGHGLSDGSAIIGHLLCCQAAWQQEHGKR